MVRVVAYPNNFQLYKGSEVDKNVYVELHGYGEIFIGKTVKIGDLDVDIPVIEVRNPKEDKILLTIELTYKELKGIHEGMKNIFKVR